MTVTGRISEEQRRRLDEISKDNKNKERLRSQKLDKDAFLKLTMAQLQNQNPLSPLDNKDMMAQMAQFTSIEQMTNMVTQQGDLNKLAALMSTQLEKLTDVLKKGDDSVSGSILSELRKLNEMLSGYLASPRTEKKAADDQILSVLKGEKVDGSDQIGENNPQQ